MADGKVRLNTEWLSGCGGCHVNLVDLHEKILDVLGAAQIQHCPLLTDIKDYPEADVGLLMGAIRNEHDREAAVKMREACKLIIAFGTCAVFGGIPGAALAHSREEILDVVYRKNPTTASDRAPADRVSSLEQMVTPVDEVIEVDLYLPGCPPHAAFTFDGLLSLIENRTPKAKKQSVCGMCKRRMVKRKSTDTIKANHEGFPEPDICFLSQGYVCLGSVTIDRCLAPCPKVGVPCTGCAGPTMQILTEPSRDIRSEVAERMARLTSIPEEDIRHAMERSAKSHYAYAMATEMVGAKPTFLIKKWIAEVEEN